jgi:hypothetical protein
MTSKDEKQRVKEWQQIRSEIRRTLMSKWDPIGVSDTPEAADEYDMYINGIYNLLKNAATDEDMTAHLRMIETERMGLTDASGNPLFPIEVCEAAVAALQDLRPLFQASKK